MLKGDKHATSPRILNNHQELLEESQFRLNLSNIMTSYCTAHLSANNVKMHNIILIRLLSAHYGIITDYPVKCMADVMRIFQPATVFKWRRELVRRKWTFRRHSRGGQQRKPSDLERLIGHLARENSDWGNGKIEGELRKLGYSLHEDTIAVILKRHGIPPLSQRNRSPS